MSVRRLDRCTPSLTPPPLGLFPPLLKVLIRSALTRFTVCLPAGKQAHSSFARTFTTSASSLGFECGCVCPQTGQVCSYSLILLCIVSCGVFGSVPLGRASLAGWMSLFWLAIACALLVWFSFLGAAGLLSFVAAVRWCWCGGRLLFCLPWWLGCLRFGPLPPGFPPPLPLGFLLVYSGPVSFCWSLPPDIWLYLQRSGCHTFGMACRG